MNRFLGINHHGLYGHIAAASHFHPSWHHHRFKVIYAEHGRIALRNALTGRFVSVGGHHTTYASPPMLELPFGWTHQRFRFQVLPPKMRPGAIVALYSPHHKRFLRMNHHDLDVGGVYEGTYFHPGWAWESWSIIDLLSLLCFKTPF